MSTPHPFCRNCDRPAHCPYCRRFVAVENKDTYFDFADAGANSHDGSNIAAFCNEDHAKRFHTIRTDS